MAQLQQQQQQQQHSLNPQQNAISNPQSQTSNHNIHQDKMGGAGSVGIDGSMSNSFRGNDQVSPFLGIL